MPRDTLMHRLDVLPRELAPLDGLEDRVVAGRATNGLIGTAPRGWRWPAALVAGLALALIGSYGGLMVVRRVEETRSNSGR